MKRLLPQPAISCFLAALTAAAIALVWGEMHLIYLLVPTLFFLNGLGYALLGWTIGPHVPQKAARIQFWMTIMGAIVFLGNVYIARDGCGPTPEMAYPDCKVFGTLLAGLGIAVTLLSQALFAIIVVMSIRWRATRPASQGMQRDDFAAVDNRPPSDTSAQ